MRRRRKNKKGRKAELEKRAAQGDERARARLLREFDDENLFDYHPMDNEWADIT